MDYNTSYTMSYTLSVTRGKTNENCVINSCLLVKLIVTFYQCRAISMIVKVIVFMV